MNYVPLISISGTGTSTIVAALVEQGNVAVDADSPEYSEEVPLLFLSGTSPDQGEFYEQLHAVSLLTAPPEVIAQRRSTRTTNRFGVADRILCIAGMTGDGERIYLSLA